MSLYTENCKLTEEGGFAIKLINDTGVITTSGIVVQASTGSNFAFSKQANQYDSIGITYESGIGIGSSCWVVVGGVADVLVLGSATKGDWVYSSTTDGFAQTLVAPPGGGIPELDEHMYEIGHCLQTVGSQDGGTLARCVIHFN